LARKARTNLSDSVSRIQLLKIRKREIREGEGIGNSDMREVGSRPDRIVRIRLQELTSIERKIANLWRSEER
jgi:hypothetical protein